MIIVRSKLDHKVIFMEPDASKVFFDRGILSVNDGLVLDINSATHEILTGIDGCEGFQPYKLSYSGSWSSDSYKSIARQKIESDRDAIIFDENAVVDIGGVNFQCGAKSLETLTQSIVLFTALGGAPAGYEWRDENNVNHPADLNFLVSIGAARAAQINQAWQDSWRKKDALEEAKTLEEIDLIIG